MNEINETPAGKQSSQYIKILFHLSQAREQRINVFERRALRRIFDLVKVRGRWPMRYKTTASCAYYTTN